MCIFADLGEKYAKMWNAKNDIFLAGPRSWKSSNFLTFWKAFKNDENATSWPQDLEMCIFADLGEKYAKMWNAQKWHFSRRSAVMKIFKFLDFLESLLKWWKSPPVDRRTLEMCIFADLGEKYAKMWNAPKWHFSRRSAVMKIFKFFDLLESL